MNRQGFYGFWCLQNTKCFTGAYRVCTAGIYCWEGQEDLASRLITPITQRITLLIAIINLLSPPDSPSRKDWGSGCWDQGLRT